MRLAPTVFSAAAAAIAGVIRLALGDDQLHWVAPSDQASPIPPITEKAIEQYVLGGATDQEIADRFLIEVTELRRDYANVIRVARAMHRIAVRRSQFDFARKPNGPMLIWLGRNELGQSANGAEADEETPSYEQQEI